MKKLLWLLLLLSPPLAVAGQAVVTWIQPETLVDGTAIPAGGTEALTGYRIEYVLCPNSAWPTSGTPTSITTAANVTTATITGLGYGTWCFRVFVSNSFGESMASSFASEVLPVPAVQIFAPQTGSGFLVGATVYANFACSIVAANACTGPVANGAAVDTSAAGTQTFSVTATDQAGNAFTTTSSYLVSSLPITTPGSIWTYAGSGAIGESGDQSLATNASLVHPYGVAADSVGNVYLALSSDNCVRRVDAATKLITTVAGICGTAAGSSGDTVPAISAQLNAPDSVAVDTFGNIFIADSGNRLVRRVDAATGIITTVAGQLGNYGNLGQPNGDGSPATSAYLSATAIALDAVGNLYIADDLNYKVRKIDKSGIITTIAGNGQSGFSGDGGPATQASFQSPTGVAVDRLGDVYIADYHSNLVRRVDAATQVISTVAGVQNPASYVGYNGDGIAATTAQLNLPIGVAVDGAGNLYISDNANQRIRKVDATTHIITTVAGSGNVGFGGDGGPATNALVQGPVAIALDPSDNLFIADNGNNRVREVVNVGAAGPAETGPLITPTITGTQGTNGWYTSNVSVTWSVSDPLSMVTSKSGCNPVLISTDTTGQTITCSATSAGGAATQSVTVKLDANAPVASATATPLPNSLGWNNGNVTAHFSGADSTSLIASCSANVTASADGADQTSPTGTCTDNAGNVSVPVSMTGINIDKTAPVVSATAAPGANGASWNNTAVIVTFTATDDGSGIPANGCTAPITLSSDGSGQSASGACTDGADNSGSASVSGINIDRTLPIATAIVTPAPNGSGWNKSNLTVSFSGTDGMSGSGIASCSASVAVSAETSAKTVSGTCLDKAGNKSPVGSAIVRLDKTAAAVTITRPASGATYTSGSVVTAAYSCSDARSGVAICTGTVANGAPINTSGIGANAFTVSASDAAGNATTASVSYTVVAAASVFVVTPTALAFGNAALNVSSASLTVSVINTGTAVVPITSISVTGTNASQFSQTNACGTSVAVGATCTISVVFRPTSAGAKSAALAIAAGGGTTTVALTGAGIVPLYSLSVATLGFGNQSTNTSSAAQTVTLANTGTIAVPITSISVTGTNASHFSQTNTCGTSVAVGATCTISVVFRPTSAGAKSASLRVTAGGGAATRSATVTGTGL